ncbi:MAG: hypothetical protein KIH89_000445 [Candidatus Shapirobacteria bacterium]|nr:hypothetical protein [Candidatus Shapirobacteria bacterium]
MTRLPELGSEAFELAIGAMAEDVGIFGEVKPVVVNPIECSKTVIDDVYSRVNLSDLQGLP